MEGGSEGEMKKPPEGENKVKRKMKTASQLEVLEKTYAVEAYPSEALRAELSEKLGLSDRQLQMWFCHRRLKDRKAVSTDKKLQNDPPPASAPLGECVEQIPVADVSHERSLASGLKPFGHLDSRRVMPRPGMMVIPRMGAGLHAMESSSYYEPHQAIEELRAIAFVERQLGEPLREDGPILGMEFDSLPPGAFGAPIGAVTMGQHRQSGRPFEAKIYEQLDKGVSRTLHEYQFIPEQPTVRNEMNERVAAPIHYNSLDGIPHARTILSSARSFHKGNESAPYGYGVQGQIPALNLLSQQGRQNHLLPSASGGTDDIPRQNQFVDVTVGTHSEAHPVTLIDGPLIPSDRRIIHEEELSRFQRKRKNEEARMQRELEAQEKRNRKELEKQDILRQKV
ncbi:Homeobox-like domain superfamily [Sesbania bispinosa]|nr:Homeobox-like domain superfamily [Sesbania bispinosa]